MFQSSEVGSELGEERAAAALATERADAEAAERLRIERDNRELLANNQRLQQVYILVLFYRVVVSITLQSSYFLKSYKLPEILRQIL